jgi:hypothetical protein
MGKISELHHLLLGRYATVKVAKTCVFSSNRSVRREPKTQSYSLKLVSAMAIESHEHAQQVSAQGVEFLARYRRQKMVVFDPSEFQGSWQKFDKN